ncbi:MAG: Smr/MutS family protein [Acidobacteriota bacterium]|nr:Smr/MutS family protein [Acidobacteriota bacterium]
MNDQAFHILEFDELRALVRRGAQTSMGRVRLDALVPLEALEELQKALAASAECVQLRKRGATWSFSELRDPAEAIGRLRVEGASLESITILEVARLCEQAMSARAAIMAEREESPVLAEIVASLPRELNSITARVANKILPGGELDDRASPDLARIRHEITKLRSSITRSLENLMRRSEEAVQDELVTIRNDRFVIPVKTDHRGHIKGVAHGFSSSGATAFVEPLETIDANNELQSLRETEEREIYRILFVLTEELRLQLAGIEMAAAAIAELDFINAKAVFHQNFNCVIPEVHPVAQTSVAQTSVAQTSVAQTSVCGPSSSPESLKSNATPQTKVCSTLEFAEARHPLLEENLRASGNAVVPVSFSLHDKHDSIIISGANAGGKTVVLKTAGLLSLMALSGLPVPASRAQVPFFASVLADIGDHQSLAANLSTFTSHVANISRMTELCRAPALILLDEVGTGTDPEEGSALGVAVVDHFRKVCGAYVMATTHYSGLKVYAATEERVLNASVEFDEKTLRPTYRLLVGIAGSSSGLEIARRFGISDQIILAASAGVNDSSLQATEYLRRIKRESEQAATLRQALEEERTAVAEKFDSLEKEAARKESQRQISFQAALERIVTDFERRSRELLATVQDRSERLKLERETQRRVAELKREAQRAASISRGREASGTPASTSFRPVRVVREGQVVTGCGATSASLKVSRQNLSEEDAHYVAIPARDIAVGDRVRLSSFGSVGIVDSVKGDEAEVRVKSLRFREKLENLELVEETAPVKREGGRFSKLRPTSTTALRPDSSDDIARSELNVIGQRADEAVDAVDKFLDAASLGGLSQLRIVHGHGTGALRRAIAELLKDHPHVARFAAAPQDQGGSGATVVELKS